MIQYVCAAHPTIRRSTPAADQRRSVAFPRFVLWPVVALVLVLGTPQLQAQPAQVDPIHDSGFEDSDVSLKPPFSAIPEGALNANTQPQALVLKLTAPVQSDTFVSITSSEPARLEVAGGGVTVPAGQSSAVVTVDAYQAGAAAVVLTVNLGNTPKAGVRVEKAMNETDLPGELDYCAAVFPPHFSAAIGSPSPELYARAFDAGITEFAGPPAGWLVGAGYGPLGTDPRQLSNWYWAAASYNLQAGNDDEYIATLLAPQASGVYNFVFRMSKDGGGSWTYCDQGGSGSNQGMSFSLAQLGRMYVYGDDVRNGSGLPAEADFCNLQFPPSLTTFAGSATNTVYGRLYEAGATEAAGAPAGWIAQAGFGPFNSDPRVPAGWTFFNAAFDTQVDNNDEFGVAMQAPNTSGQYAYVFRFSQDSGSTWTYCDLDGAGSNGSLPFSPSQLGTLTVNVPP